MNIVNARSHLAYPARTLTRQTRSLCPEGDEAEARVSLDWQRRESSGLEVQRVRLNEGQAGEAARQGGGAGGVVEGDVPARVLMCWECVRGPQTPA